MRGIVAGPLRLAVAANAPGDAVGALMIALSEHYHHLDVTLTHATSPDVLAGVRSSALDAGFCVEDSDLDDLIKIEAARFGTYLAAPAGLIDKDQPLDWQDLAERVWITPDTSSYCGRAVGNLFRAHNI